MASGNRVRNRAGRNRLSSQGSSLLGGKYRRLCRVEPLEQRRLLNADWTVLVYMAADNDLDNYALLDIKEMEVFGSSDDVNIVVQWDGDYGEEEGTRRGKITQDDDPDDVDPPPHMIPMIMLEFQGIQPWLPASAAAQALPKP